MKPCSISAVCWILLFLPSVGRADTLRLKRGVDINGTVTYSNGNFTIQSRFRGRPEQMTIGREYVSEVRFNGVLDNPGEPEGWMKQLQHIPTKGTASSDKLRMVDNKEVQERVLAMNETMLVTDKGSHQRSTVLTWALSDE